MKVVVIFIALVCSVHAYAADIKKISGASAKGRRGTTDWRKVKSMTDEETKHLFECFLQLDGKKAVGVDGITKEQYDNLLNENLEYLLDRMRRMAYRPQPVLKRLIPKEGKLNATRPLGISVFEDKIVQKSIAVNVDGTPGMGFDGGGEIILEVFAREKIRAAVEMLGHSM